MNENNKKQLVKGLKVLSVFLLAFIVLIPNVEIWNLKSEGYTDTFHVILSIMNLVVGSMAIVFYYKKIFNK